MIIRFIDIMLSIIGIIVTLPFYPVIALLIKIDSRGPVFFSCNRIGKDNKTFKMYKFRTMLDVPIEVGTSVSPKFDPRVCPFGRFLRRSKLNEVPQFFNILKGEMTFVGPRPEAPDLAAMYPEEARKIFSVKPGLVGPNQIIGFNEEDQFPVGVDEKEYYIKKLLPQKIEVDLKYIRNQTLLGDLTVILVAAKKIFLSTLTLRRACPGGRQLALLVADTVLTTVSFVLASVLGMEKLAQGGTFAFLALIPLVIAVRIVSLALFGRYSGLERHLSYRTLVNVTKAVASGSLALAGICWLLKNPWYSGFVALLDSCALIIILSYIRFAFKVMQCEREPTNNEGKIRRILIFGAGYAGELAYRVLKLEKNNGFQVAGFVDDAPEKYGKTLDGVKVLGNRHTVEALAKLYEISEVIVAAPSMPPRELGAVFEICREAGLACRIFAPLGSGQWSANYSFPARAPELSDIIPIPRISMAPEMARSMVANRTVVVCGSGGSLGLELCRLILAFGCKGLILVERYEAYLSECIANLSTDFREEKLFPVLLSEGEPDLLEKVFGEHHPEIVFHASMRKHVPLFATTTKYIDEEAIARTNWERTLELADLAVRYGSESFCMISSLAAGNPGDNPILASLRAAELSLRELLEGTSTRLIISRIGDVVENRGGIVSILEDQIRRSDVVTLPHHEAKLHLLSKRSAAEFILQTLVEARSLPTREGVFICDTGSPVTIEEVARGIAGIYGCRLGVNLGVRYIKSTANANGGSHLRYENSQLLPTGHQNVKFLQERVGFIPREFVCLKMGDRSCLEYLERKNRRFGEPLQSYQANQKAR